MRENVPYLYGDDGYPTHWREEYSRRASKRRKGPEKAKKWWQTVQEKHLNEQACKRSVDKSNEVSNG